MGPGSGEYHGSTCFEFNAQLLRVWLVLVYTTIRGFDLDQKKKTIASKFQCFCKDDSISLGCMCMHVILLHEDLGRSGAGVRPEVKRGRKRRLPFLKRKEDNPLAGNYCDTSERKRGITKRK